MIKYKKGTLLFLLALLLLPFEAIKGILPSTYRPISIYPLAIIFIFAACKKLFHPKMDKVLFKYIVFCVYCLFSTYIITWYKFENFKNTKVFIVTFIMGIITFISCDYSFSIIKKGISNDDYILYVFKIIGNMYFVAIFIGIIELLSILNVLPLSIKSSINNLLGAGQLTRVCMGSSEASWLSMHLLIMMPIYIYLHKVTREKKYMVAFVFITVIFIFNVSGQGIITLLISFAIYIIINMGKKNNINTLVKNFALIIIALVGAFLIFKFVIDLMPNTYYTARLKNFTNISSLIRNDASSFIRIVYPILNFKIFLNYPILGIGGGNFSFLFSEYLYKFYPWAVTSYGEVAAHVSANDASTYCFYARLLSEFGIIGVILFINFVSSITKKFKRYKINNNRNILLFIFILTFAILVQFDSFTYIPFWLMLAFYNNLEDEKETI